MKIYIGFSEPTGKFVPFATLIKWVEARPFDHCYIRVQEPMNKEYVIFQASKAMINVYNKDIWQSYNSSYREYEVEISQEQYEKVWKFVVKNLGIPYSLKEDFGILLMKIFKIKNNIFDAGMSASFCSKLGAIICKEIGIEIKENASIVDPSLLESLLSKEKLVVIEKPLF